jgi:hypothetical protein
MKLYLASNFLEDTMFNSRFLKLAPAMLLIAGLSSTMLAQVEGPVPATALISVQSKNGAPLDPSSLRLQINRHDSPITSVTPVTPGNTQIAILIDDGLRGSFNLQLEDIKHFITALRPGTKVLIGYMQNGVVRSETGFTADHDEAIAQLRISLSSPGIDASPYFCLSDFVKKWPSNEPGARFVLMITNGVDPYNGSTSILNQNSPYVQTAQEDAQRAGVAVYSIYYGESGMRGGRGSFSGQSYLQQVAEATGGDSFYQGTIPPPSFAPYLGEFNKAIAESYVVNFPAPAPRNKRDTLTQIKLTSSQPGVKIHAPENVRPGAAVDQ